MTSSSPILSSKAGLYRGPGRRSAKHRHCEQRLRDLEQSLNELDGFGVGCQVPTGVGPVDAAGRQRLETRVREFGFPPPELDAVDGTPVGLKAFRELLKSHADYTGVASLVLPLCLSSLALPSGEGQPARLFGSDASEDSLFGGRVLRQVLAASPSR